MKYPCIWIHYNLSCCIIDEIVLTKYKSATKINTKYISNYHINHYPIAILDQNFEVGNYNFVALDCTVVVVDYLVVHCIVAVVKCLVAEAKKDAAQDFLVVEAAHMIASFDYSLATFSQKN